MDHSVMSFWFEFIGALGDNFYILIVSLKASFASN